MLTLLQEVYRAHSILQSESFRLGGKLDPIVPIILQGHLPSLNEQLVSTKSRRVFLSTQQGEDLWWTVESVNFVVDTGTQKKMVTKLYYKTF